ncbi:PREDICTED: uncharacterized protein LOC104021663, partial [Nipponia nippon]|uniref:uncharacterized protein LOC104021663 n=1 Tax=Nipponia nippon TaxID=128390 RepID=UPI000510DD27
VHLFGASLGGFLAQKFAEYTHKSPRVQSLILCNSFSDTSIFNQTWTANSFWLMPAFMLKKIVLGNFASGPLDPEMADGIDFMVDRLESLGQSELASRLTLNCQNSYVEPHKIRDIPVTIMDVFDQSALSTEAKEEMYKLYPNARRAHLKTGGNFPYLCRSAEVNLYIQVSLCIPAETALGAPFLCSLSFLNPPELSWATIEEAYSRSMTKLAKSASNYTQLGTFAPVWDVFKTSTEKLASCHLDLVRRLQELIKEVHKYGDEQIKTYKKTKEDVSGTLEAVQNIQSITQALQKSKENYNAKCVEQERLKKEGATQREVDKAAVKSKKATDTYKLYVEKYAVVKSVFEQKMTETAQ